MQRYNPEHHTPGHTIPDPTSGQDSRNFWHFLDTSLVILSIAAFFYFGSYVLMAWLKNNPLDVKWALFMVGSGILASLFGVFHTRRHSSISTSTEEVEELKWDQIKLYSMYAATLVCGLTILAVLVGFILLATEAFSSVLVGGTSDEPTHFFTEAAIWGLQAIMAAAVFLVLVKMCSYLYRYWISGNYEIEKADNEFLPDDL